MDEAIKRSENIGKRLKTAAHDYDHFNRVRNWVVLIAKDEGLNERGKFLLEISALWHDMALDKVTDRSKHGEVAGEMFLHEFKGYDVFTENEKETIFFMLKYHDKARLVRNSKTDKKLLQMLNILTDADTLELLGERGYERALETARANNWPNFDTNNPKGETYGFSAKQFDERFELTKTGKIKHVKEPTLVGLLNFLISCADNLYSSKAKTVGKAGADYLKSKIDYIIGQ